MMLNLGNVPANHYTHVAKSVIAITTSYFEPLLQFVLTLEGM
jgi:hypothetical protein